MELSEIIRANARYMQDVSVDINPQQDWVEIIDDLGERETIFLDGGEASSFIDEVNSLWEEVGDIDKDTIALHLAMPYVDCIWN